MSKTDLELDIIENFHFDFNYDIEPSLYLHKEHCEGHIITRSGYCIYCSNPDCNQEVTKHEL